jgi:predicted esterase
MRSFPITLILPAVACLIYLAVNTAACDSGDSGDNKTGSDTGLTADVVADLKLTVDVAAETIPSDVVVEPDMPVADDNPLGPQPPAPLKPATGDCPHFVAGTNEIVADGRKRSFELTLPPSPEHNSSVVFLWHGNGDWPKNFTTFFNAQITADNNGAIIVVPADCCGDNQDDCCDQSMTWNMGEFSKKEADMALFDDILYCLEEQFDINNKRVYTSGFSAGSLWSTYLVLNRSEYLAAAVIFSGGTGLVFDYKTPDNSIPLLLAWGGPNDTFMGVVNFEQMMGDFSTNAQSDGHFIIECNHGLGHTIPYGGTNWAYEFLFMHEWGMDTSPYETTGLSMLYPDYCSIP